MGGLFKVNGGGGSSEWLVLTFTSDTTWKVPLSVTSVEVFAVGGGASGSSRSSSAGNPGNGGNGGQVIHRTISVTPGETISIKIGAGGKSNIIGNDGNAGGDTTFGTYITALGGSAGIRSNTGDQPTVENSAKGGRGTSAGTGTNGGDGKVCPFESTGHKYGGAGAGGCNPYGGHTTGGTGGATGGGNSGFGANNTFTNVGGDATFYGGAGGGAAFCSGQNYCTGGIGFQGIIKIKYLG